MSMGFNYNGKHLPEVRQRKAANTATTVVDNIDPKLRQQIARQILHQQGLEEAEGFLKDYLLQTAHFDEERAAERLKTQLVQIRERYFKRIR